MSGSTPRKIDLMIIGAQKSGTTSLLRYLGEHPEISGHTANECSFFYDDEEFSKGWEQAYSFYFGRTGDSKKFIVAKHAHLYSSPVAIERLHKTFPAVKIVLLLRNPTSRTYSSYLMERMYERVDYEFDELPRLRSEENAKKFEEWQEEAFFGFSKYDEHLENVYKYFLKENVKVILFEDFSSSPLQHCRMLFKWIGAKEDFFPRVRTKHNETTEVRSRFLSRMIRNTLVKNSGVKTAAKIILPNRAATRIGQGLRDMNRSGKNFPPMSENMKSYLEEYFRPHNERLQKLTGLDLSLWQ